MSFERLLSGPFFNWLRASLMLHMFLAHVKIAFLIHMQVVHDIDMRNDDVQDPTMRNHCFLVCRVASRSEQALDFFDSIELEAQRARR